MCYVVTSSVKTEQHLAYALKNEPTRFLFQMPVVVLFSIQRMYRIYLYEKFENARASYVLFFVFVLFFAFSTVTQFYNGSCSGKQRYQVEVFSTDK